MFGSVIGHELCITSFPKLLPQFFGSEYFEAAAMVRALRSSLDSTEMTGESCAKSIKTDRHGGLRTVKIFFSSFSRSGCDGHGSHGSGADGPKALMMQKYKIYK